MSLFGLGIGLASSIYNGISAGKRRNDARDLQNRLQTKLDDLELRRQTIINPYDGITSLAGLAMDMSSQLTNTYANLGVATKAAEIQIEEADIALANTLDTLRATGSGAGGATALAQAAARSKKGVSANIEKQEAQNEKLRAQGESELQNARLSEKRRIQGIQISEGGRVQNAEAQGKGFMFSTKENRQMQKLNRVASQLDNATQNAANADSNQTAAWMNLGTSLGGFVTGIEGLDSDDN
tara:strand:- start:55 stop:774 length:720 start_codon:yes stop_codon:yes gene_type:complete